MVVPAAEPPRHADWAPGPELGPAPTAPASPRVAQSPPHTGGHSCLINGKGIFPLLGTNTPYWAASHPLSAVGAPQPVALGRRSQQQLEASKQLQGQRQGWTKDESPAQALPPYKGLWFGLILCLMTRSQARHPGACQDPSPSTGPLGTKHPRVRSSVCCSPGSWRG